MRALARWRHRRRKELEAAGLGLSPAGLAGPAARERQALQRWAVLGAALGALVSVMWFAPASWLAQAVSNATGERVLLHNSQGSVWAGSAQVVLSGGSGSRQAIVLPERVQWRLGWEFGRQGLAAVVDAELPCCFAEGLLLRGRPGLGTWRWELAGQPDGRALAQWPLAWMAGLGAPWNTLQLSGRVVLTSPGLVLEQAQGRQAVTGAAELLVEGLGSPLSTLPQLGSYRLGIQGQGGQGAQLELHTLRGPLQLAGSGVWAGAGSNAGAGGLRFRGQATAEAGSEEALSNLLNLIGRRQGALSLLSIG
jgi:general secretion pathway protein N